MLCVAPVRAQPATSQPAALSAQELTKEAINPFADEVKLTIGAAAGFGVGSRDNTGAATNLQPTLPLPLGSDWNVIAMPFLQAQYLPSPDETFGLTDSQLSLFLTPRRAGSWIWGLGPIFEFPTATDGDLGTGKWSAGPTGALIYSQGPWFNGVLASHLTSFAGKDSRDTVNLTSIELLASYTFESGWYVQTNPTITYDWTGDAWTVPIGADVGTTLHIGSHSMTLQIGGYDLVERPSGSPAVIVRTQLTWQFSTGS
jgi:hypothetical protein